MKKLATISILEVLEKETRKLTHLQTAYLYADIRIDYLAQYFSKVEVKYSQSETLRNIEISSSNLNMAEAGTVFTIDTDIISDSQEFIHFAKKLSSPIVQLFQQDRFLLDFQEQLKIIPLQYNDFISSDNEVQDSRSLQNLSFLSKLSPDKDFVKNLEESFDTLELYYDVYDVNGFFSVITDDNGFDFYIDMGDISNNKIPINSNPYCILISHYHLDHYNLLQNSGVKGQNYILPYSGSILFNGIQHYNANEIRLLMGDPSNTHLIFTSKSPKLGRNKLSKFKFTSKINLYIPEYSSPHNRNLESICLEIIDSKHSIFYPADTKNYMYFPYLIQYDWFIAAHHGGDVGKLNLKGYVFDNILVNTHYKNLSLYLSNYKPLYTSQTPNLVEGLSNNGAKIVRIKL